MRLVLDADVLIGALDAADAHHPVVRALFTDWHNNDATLLVSVVNLSEALIAPAVDKRLLRRAREAIATLGVTIQQPNEAIGVDAARLRCLHPISLPDAYCLATGRHANAAATGDHPAGADEVVLEPGHRLVLDVAARVRRRDHLAVARVDHDVGGARARAFMRETYSLEALGRRYLERLTAISRA